eukprot:gene907-1013_t
MELKLLSSDPWSRNRPKRVQFNDVIAALQSLLRVEGYDSTWVEAEALKIERFFTEFGCRLKCSYVYDDCCRAVNPKDIARTLKRFLPLPSEEDLERRVNEEGCSGSMVRLAVALKWGLHRPGRPSSADYALSSEYFRRAAAADNPIACVNMAYDCYTSLLSIVESHTRIVVDITTPIPPRREAQRTKNWQPSNLALGMLQRYDEKNTIISIDNVREFHNKCFYCRARLSEPYTRCPTCKLATYCGVACQIIDWQHGHRLDCGQLAEIEPIITEIDNRKISFLTNRVNVMVDEHHLLIRSIHPDAPPDVFEVMEMDVGPDKGTRRNPVGTSMEFPAVADPNGYGDLKCGLCESGVDAQGGKEGVGEGVGVGKDTDVGPGRCGSPVTSGGKEGVGVGNCTSGERLLGAHEVVVPGDDAVSDRRTEDDKVRGDWLYDQPVVSGSGHSHGHGRRRRGHRRRRHQRRSRRPALSRSYRSPGETAVAEEDEDSEKDEVLLMVCAAIPGSDLATNLSYCPICRIDWTEFDHNALATVLVCKHATCLSCLSRYNKACSVSFEQDTVEGELNTLFVCSICRSPISNDTLAYAAKWISEQYLADISDSVNMAEMLPLSAPDRNSLLSHLLLHHDFNLDVVERTVFNMVGSIGAGDGNERGGRLTRAQKQTIYHQARAPVLSLQEEYDELQRRVADLEGRDRYVNGALYRTLRSQMRDLKPRLKAARINAANDIFERMNSTSGNMGAFTEGRDVFIDVHGLHVEEAKAKVQELLLPVISVLRKAYVITGRGNHSANRRSVLKKALMELIVGGVGGCHLRCQEVSGNDGVLRITCHT